MTPDWLIVAGDYHQHGGMDRANYELAWHLADRLGKRVLLVGFSVAEPLASHPLVKCVVVRRPLGSTALGLLRLRKLAQPIVDRLAAESPKTRIVVNGGNCKGPDINWVHMVHHAFKPCDSRTPVGFQLRNRFHHWRSKWDEKRSLAAAQLIIANSHKTRRELIQYLGVAEQRVQVVYLGADPVAHSPMTAEERRTGRQRFEVPQQTIVIGFIGALGLDRNKGFDVLLAAARLLAVEGVPLTILAAGSGNLPYWKRQAETLGLGASVRLCGHLTDMRSFLAACDLVVSPTRHDAYGLAVHEAICCEVPVLVSSQAGVAERFPDSLRCCILSDPNDAAELVLRFRHWQAHRQTLQTEFVRLGAELRKQTWSRMASEFVQLAEEVADSPRPSSR